MRKQVSTLFDSRRTHRAVVLFLAFLLALAFGQPTGATCFSGWEFKLAAPLPELYFIKGVESKQTIKFTVNAAAKPGATACNLYAWSKMPGVSVAFSSGAPATVAASSADKVVYAGGGSYEYALTVVVNALATGDGVIEIRHDTADIQAVKDARLIGTIKVHVRAPQPPERCVSATPISFQWFLGYMPSGLLNHERELPDYIAEELKQAGVKTATLSRNGLPATLDLTLDTDKGHVLLIGSAPPTQAFHQVQFSLFDKAGCRRGELFLSFGITPQPFQLFGASLNASVASVCSLTTSHKLTVNWKVVGVQSATEIKIEGVSEDGRQLSWGTMTLEGSHEFSLNDAGGGLLNLKLTARDAQFRSTTSFTSASFAACRSKRAVQTECADCQLAQASPALIMPVVVLPPKKVTLTITSICTDCSAVAVPFTGAPVKITAPDLGYRLTAFSFDVTLSSSVSLKAPLSVTTGGRSLQFKHWLSVTDGTILTFTQYLTKSADKAQAFAAVYGVRPGTRGYTYLRLHAVRVADDLGYPGMGILPKRRADITPDQVKQLVDKANEVYLIAGIQYEFDPDLYGPDWTDLANPTINKMEGNQDPDWVAEKDAANTEAAKYPGKLVVFFRYGSGSSPTGGGFSWSDLKFVAMPGWSTLMVCGSARNLGLFAHEVGHFLGLAHTFAKVFDTEKDAETYLKANGNKASAFDGDSFSDTPPDPFMRRYYSKGIDCGPTPTTVALNGQAFTLPRTNVMSYYHPNSSVSTEVRTLTTMQLNRVREIVKIRLGAK